MTALTGKTPSPALFAATVKSTFGDAIRDAAGADGRISKNEAKKIADRAGPEWIVSDNVENYLKFTGQKSVSAEKMIRKLGEFAESNAASVAGTNQKLSLVEAKSLSSDLQAEFFYLRGKGLPERVTKAELAVVVGDMVRDALDGETMTKLDTPPWQVMGKQPLIWNIPHDASQTRATVYEAAGEIYISRATSIASATSLVGWYHVGSTPDLS